MCDHLFRKFGYFSKIFLNFVLEKCIHVLHLHLANENFDLGLLLGVKDMLVVIYRSRTVT